MIIGSGTHQYEVIDGWCQLPEGMELGYTHGVVEDSQGQIYIHNASKDAVCIFDPEGKYIKSWGSSYAEGAHGLYYSKESDGEYLYLATTKQGTVEKTTLDGEVIWSISQPDLPEIYDGEKKKFVPTETTVAENGDVYVADGYGQSYIHRYNAKGEYLNSFGGPGDGEGKLKCPHGIMIDTRGSEPLLLISDRGNNRLQYFKLDGSFVRFAAHGIILRPCTTEQFGDEIYIPDLYSRVTILDKNDQLISHLGEREEGWKIEKWPNIAHDLRQPGKFTSPHDLHVDQAGNIYVAEWINDGRVTKLKRL